MQAVVDRPPTSGPIDGGEGGGGGDWVCLYRAKGDIEAHLLAGRLEAAGIETTTLKDRRGAAWLHGGSDPLSPMDIMVRRLQLDDARFVLAEIAYEQPASKPAPTPTDLKTALVWWGAAIVLGLTFTGIALARTSEQIERCASRHCEQGPVRP